MRSYPNLIPLGRRIDRILETLEEFSFEPNLRRWWKANVPAHAKAGRRAIGRTLPAGNR